jgi:GR25 family glycosyltransferase involved in LPS biosynthesis
MKKTKFNIWSIIIVILLIISIFYFNYSSRGKEGFENIIDRDDFDCYLINLEKNPERLRSFSKYYDESDLSTTPFLRIDAINGKMINNDPEAYKEYISPNSIISPNSDTEFPFTAGMVGCFLSHLSAYKKITEGDKPYGLIFEDDAKMDPEIYDKYIKSALKDIPGDWDIILFGYDISNPQYHKFEKIDKHYKMQEFWGLHGYMLNKKSAKKLFEIMQPPFIHQLDAQLCILVREDKIKIYGIENPVVFQDGSWQTDVQPPK